MRKRRPLAIALIVALVGLSAVLVWFFFLRDTGDPRLRPFVQSPPSYPIVFTSRTEPASFRAASTQADFSPTGAAVRSPGQGEWQAREGRLRVLLPSGSVRELTWGKPLPDGGTLIDVMSPSISADARTVYFAGRRADAHGGRFRLYSVRLDGSELKPLTGGEADPGCSALPPVRFTADGSRLPDDARRRLDYDDVDPVEVPPGVIVFASSRTPDAGGRSRRATQLWVKDGDQNPRPLTASRANDRWPFVTSDRSLVFTLWSRLDDVVAADGSGLARYDPPRAGLTAPTDGWLGANIQPTGEAFSHTVKVPEPVWRPRPLFNGRIVFMSPAPKKNYTTITDEKPETGIMRVAQAEHGRVGWSPSSLAADSEFPKQADPSITYLPTVSADNRRWSMATPSPMPPDRVVLSAAQFGDNDTIAPTAYGLYSARQDNWTAGALELTPLFDDPEFVDAEPVAVYRRAIPDGPLRLPNAWDAKEVKTVRTATGEITGPAGKLDARQLTDTASGGFPGQQPKGGEGRIVPNFPAGSIKRIAFYASHRDRFDDPDRTVVRGLLEKLFEVPVDPTGTASAEATMPTGSPTLLVGLGGDGKVVSATGAADSSGKRGKFFAFAGDHVSGMRAGGYVFCTGCHTGHTFTPTLPVESVK